MFAVFATWVIVFAGVLDRLAYAVTRLWRRPLQRAAELVRTNHTDEARRLVDRERARAALRIDRIDAVSQLATSVGLFGTVLGIARAFFARGGPGSSLELADTDVLTGALATALFTTVAGLVVFLFGQGFLILWRDWTAAGERRFEAVLEAHR